MHATAESPGQTTANEPPNEPPNAPPAVIVVGGGLAGLTAAVVLYEAGVRVQLLEGAARLGGRIDTVRDATSAEPLADLGPTWVWPPYQPVVTRWLRRLGIRTFAQFDAGDAMVDGWGPTPQRAQLPRQEGIMRLVGGPGSLITALADRLPPEAVRLNAPVQAVGPAVVAPAVVAPAVVGRTAAGDAHPEMMLVTLASGESLRAERVILATPLRATVERMTLSGLGDGAAAQLRAAMSATPTWMSTHAKVVAVYAAPFWRERGLSGRIASRSGPLTEVHDHTPYAGGQGALFGFVGWPAEQRARDPDGLRAAVLAQLERCLGADAATPLALHVRDWAREPLICSNADAAAAPAHPEVGPSVLRDAHLGGRLRFAVSEASAVSPGLIEGALAAGEAAASVHLP